MICLAATEDGDYHQNCLDTLFGTKRLPRLDIELDQLSSVAARMAGKMSISGIQEKVSLALSSDRTELRVAAAGGRYILKPESSRFLFVPQNEHLTMRLATLMKIDVPPLGLLRLADRSIAYIVKRFDRLDDGSKLHVEDFCQLSKKPLRDKYEGSAELCVRLLRTHATEPLIQVRDLYRLVLFGWWAANGDMHLKNFSVITRPDGRLCLSPAYDLVSTRLVIPADDRLALPIGGRDRNLTRRTWLEFADYCQIPTSAAERLIAEQIRALKPAVALIDRSYLPDERKNQYEAILRDNTQVLAGGVADSV